LNFKGFAVGNPYTTVYTGLHAMIETGWGHSLIAQPTYQKFRSNHCLEMDTPNYPVS
jgi:beta-N-acetylglucosaminidase